MPVQVTNMDCLSKILVTGSDSRFVQVGTYGVVVTKNFVVILDNLIKQGGFIEHYTSEM